MAYFFEVVNESAWVKCPENAFRTEFNAPASIFTMFQREGPAVTVLIAEFFRQILDKWLKVLSFRFPGKVGQRNAEEAIPEVPKFRNDRSMRKNLGLTRFRKPIVPTIMILCDGPAP